MRSEMLGSRDRNSQFRSNEVNDRTGISASGGLNMIAANSVVKRPLNISHVQRVSADCELFTSSLTSSVRNVDDDTGGYDLELIDVTENERLRYNCPICLLLLRDPVQTTCGHRFCQQCIRRWCSEVPECPECKYVLSSTDVFPDNCTKREILNLKARCPNKKHGCDVILPIGQLQTHRSVCKSAKLLCEFCGEQISKLELDRHLAETCAAAQVECPFYAFGCLVKSERRSLDEHLSHSIQQHLRLLATHVANHRCSCSSRKNPHHSNADQRQFQLQRYTEPVKLPGLDISDLYDDVGMVSLPARTDTGPPPSYFTEERLAEICRLLQEQRTPPPSRAASKQTDSRGAACQLVSLPAAQNPLTYVKQPTDVQSTEITTPVSNEAKLNQQLHDQSLKLAQYESRIASLEARVMELESDSGCQNGVYVMKIASFTSRCLPEARTGQCPVIYSQAFYSHPQGYKFCLRVHPCGIKQTEQLASSNNEPQLSLFIHLMRGDFDDILDWPFRGCIKLCVLDLRSFSTTGKTSTRNQSTLRRKDITACVAETDPTLEAFQRPTSVRNRRGFGYIDFTPVSTLLRGSENDPTTSPYLMNDTLYIRAVVEPIKTNG